VDLTPLIRPLFALALIGSSFSPIGIGHFQSMAAGVFARLELIEIAFDR
jgi:nicotinic acid mononucleotide adenylyltransferase